MENNRHEVPCFGKKLAISIPQTLTINGTVYEVVAVNPQQFETIQITPTEGADHARPHNRHIETKSEFVRIPVIIGIQSADPTLPSTIAIPITELLASALQHGSNEAADSN